MPLSSSAAGIRRAMYRMMSQTAVAVVVLLGCVLAAVAQDPNASAAYIQAMREIAGPDRADALETFVTAYPKSNLRADALEALTWTYWESGNTTGAVSAANQLASIDANNAVALAFLGDAVRRTEDAKPHLGSDELRRNAERGLAAYPAFRPPSRMAPLEAYRLERQVLAMLEGALGFTAFQQKDYATAQTYLRQAVQISPNNAADVYSLALVDLAATPPDAAEGFTLLARAVRLSQQTPAGPQIAQFARQRYVEAGGSTQDWDRYLSNAGASNASAVGAPPERNTTARETTTQQGEKAAPAHTDSRSEKRKKGKTESAKADVPDLPPSVRSPEDAAPPRPTKPRPPNGAPISLGIVIEASQVRGKQGAIVDGLTDMLGYLRQGDEAFILAFGNELDFTQDLTGSRRDLEEALSKMKSEGGAALYEAVGVAAGHLNRIARNPNRVLLVISDGRNSSSPNATYELESNLEDVRIFCIGVGVGSADDQRFLQALAQRTGGAASFVPDLNHFSTASESLARSIYAGGM